MAKKDDATQQLIDVVQTLQRDVSRSLAGNNMEVKSFGLQIGVQIQRKIKGVEWALCASTKAAQHFIHLEVPVVQLSWREEAELTKLVEPSEPAALGGASESEQLEHVLRMELEKLGEELEDDAPVRKTVVKKKVAVKVKAKGKAKRKTKAKAKSKSGIKKRVGTKAKTKTKVKKKAVAKKSGKAKRKR